MGGGRELTTGSLAPARASLRVELAAALGTKCGFGSETGASSSVRDRPPGSVFSSPESLTSRFSSRGFGKSRTVARKGAEHVDVYPNGFQLAAGHGTTGGPASSAGRGVFR